MGSVDVNSLYTNIRVQTTINRCTNALFENTERVKRLSKNNAINFCLATKESYFNFNGKLYKQANVFSCKL